jgi:hypothetical protein
LTKLAFGGIMTQSSMQSPVTIHELLISSLAQTDALAKLPIEKGLLASVISAITNRDIPASVVMVSCKSLVAGLSKSNSTGM